MKLREWYAVDCTIEVCPPPSAMLDSFRPPVKGLTHDFEIDEGHWNTGRFLLPSCEAPVISMRRIRPGEEGFLWDREGWEDWLKTMPDEPNRERILAHLRKLRQTIHLSCLGIGIEDKTLARLCEQLSGYLARAGDGLIRVFEEGFFSSEGESLLPYYPRHKLRTT